MTTASNHLEHEPFCLPRAGEDEVRIERYTQPRYDQDGTSIVAMIAIVRCLECGVATYDGKKG